MPLRFAFCVTAMKPFHFQCFSFLIFRWSNRLFPTARQFRPTTPTPSRFWSSGQRFWHSQSIPHKCQPARFQLPLHNLPNATCSSRCSECPTTVQITKPTKCSLFEESGHWRSNGTTAAVEKSRNGTRSVVVRV